MTVTLIIADEMDHFFGYSITNIIEVADTNSGPKLLLMNKKLQLGYLQCTGYDEKKSQFFWSGLRDPIECSLFHPRKAATRSLDSVPIVC